MAQEQWVGLDVGASSAMVVGASGEIIRNELGGHSSASVVAFDGNERYVGEAGVSQLSVNAANAVPVGELISLNEALKVHRRFSCDQDSVTVAYAGQQQRKLQIASVLAALLRKLGSLATARLGTCKFAVAAPPCATPEQLQLVRVAAKAARLVPATEDASFQTADACLRRVYAWKHGPSIPAGETRVVAIVDVGRCSALCTVAEFTTDSVSRVLSTTSSRDDLCGTAALDAALFDWVLAHKLEGERSCVRPGTKKGARLLGAVERVRKLLSTMKEAKVTCENLGEDCDVDISATRDDLRTAAAKVLTHLRSLLETCRCEVDAVEVLGGGGRVALFRDLIADVFGVAEDSLGAKLDDASVAHGAALLAADAATVNGKEDVQMDVDGTAPETAADSKLPPPPPPTQDVVKQEEPRDEEPWMALASLEDEMCARDRAVAAVSEQKNELETTILELRSARSSGPHCALLANDELGGAIDAAEQWLWDNETDAVEPGPFAEKVAALRRVARELCPAYFEAVEAAKKRVDDEMEAEAVKKDDDDDDDDEAREDRLNADTRKLKFSDRFRLVQKNKDEGTELFKGGNIQHSIKRYRDALAHAAKLGLSSLSPEQERQTKQIKLDLHVNISLCWTKLDNIDQSLRASNEALKLDDAYPKALYRRAFAYEHQKRFDDAKQDITNALAHVPDDKALLALQKRVDVQIARQKKKEKDMWGKAFK